MRLMAEALLQQESLEAGEIRDILTASGARTVNSPACFATLVKIHTPPRDALPRPVR
jgi:hypothetical protein